MFEDLIAYGESWLQVIKSHLTLFKLEAKLARMSIVPLSIAAFFACNLIFATWLGVLSVIGYGIFAYTHSVFTVCWSLLLINFVCLLLVALFAYSQIRNMQFRKTKALLRQLSQERTANVSQTTEETNPSH